MRIILLMGITFLFTGCSIQSNFENDLERRLQGEWFGEYGDSFSFKDTLLVCNYTRDYYRYYLDSDTIKTIKKYGSGFKPIKFRIIKLSNDTLILRSSDFYYKDTL